MEEIYWFWLCNIPGIWQYQIEKLIKRFTAPGEIYKAGKETLEKSGCLNACEIKNVISSRNMKVVEKKLDDLKREKTRFIFPGHPDFPGVFKDIPDRPFGIYVKGRMPDERKPSVGMVGARNCTGYGKEAALKYAGFFARNEVQIISGMAAGIDTYAALGAMKNGGSTYAVLGTGIDIIYPYQNMELYYRIQENGGLISEYPPGTPGTAWHFPHRNRLISALSDKLIIIEAGKRSGTLTTARHALNQGKDIYALPGRVNDPLSEGCNMLISEGCGIMLNAGYIVDELYLKKPFPPHEKRSPVADDREPGAGLADNDKTCGKAKDGKAAGNKEKTENKDNGGKNGIYESIIKCLSYEPESVQNIIKKTGLPADEAANALTELELSGIIEEASKDCYIKCII